MSAQKKNTAGPREPKRKYLNLKLEDTASATIEMANVADTMAAQRDSSGPPSKGMDKIPRSINDRAASSPKQIAITAGGARILRNRGFIALIKPPNAAVERPRQMLRWCPGPDSNRYGVAPEGFSYSLQLSLRAADS
jgi:hypothetical protein